MNEQDRTQRADAEPSDIFKASRDSELHPRNEDGKFVRRTSDRMRKSSVRMTE